MLPLKVGNYWIYKTVEIDSTGTQPVETFIDSFVVTRSVNIEGIDGYEIKIFRDGSINDTAYMRTNGSTILVYCIGLKPIFHFTSSDCEYLYNKKWAKLFSARIEPWYYNEFSDTMCNEAVVYDEETDKAESIRFYIDMETYFTATLARLNGFFFKSKKVEAYNMMFTGQTLSKLLSPDKISFTTSGNSECMYKGNNRILLSDELEFSIIFGKNIGILFTTEIHKHCLGNDLKRERKLLRYGLN